MHPDDCAADRGIQASYRLEPEAESVARIAKRLGISRSVLYPFVTNGDLASIKIGKRRLVRVETARAWLKNLERRGV